MFVFAPIIDTLKWQFVIKCPALDTREWLACAFIDYFHPEQEAKEKVNLVFRKRNV